MAKKKHRVVIIGGGFGGLAVALGMRKADAEITMIDRKNYHLFQPLLYQVATGTLSSGDIASPLRSVLNKQKNTGVVLGEVTDIDPNLKVLFLEDREIPYDTLILAAGSTHHYFGNDAWSRFAPGLKTVEDAAEIRRRVLLAFETAERENDQERINALLTFMVIGAGPTGVELAGALAEISRKTMKNDFRNIDPARARIILVEGTDRVLGTYPEELSNKGEKSLENLGVEVITASMVNDIGERSVTVKMNDVDKKILCETILWAAGVKSSPIAEKLAEKLNLETDRQGRIPVDEYLRISGRDDIFVIGDMARLDKPDGEPLPGVASVARQQGAWLGRFLKKRLSGKEYKPFKYSDYGSMATIGKSAAVADLGWLRLTGWFGWITWLFVHLMYIVEFENRVLVLVQWAWNYITNGRSNRLILGRDVAERVKSDSDPETRNSDLKTTSEIF